MNDVSDLKPGDPVCIVGRGSDNMIHEHGRVTRLTKTMIIVNHRRFRFDGSSVPYSSYGGTCIAARCQVKK